MVVISDISFAMSGSCGTRYSPLKLKNIDK